MEYKDLWYFDFEELFFKYTNAWINTILLINFLISWRDVLENKTRKDMLSEWYIKLWLNDFNEYLSTMNANKYISRQTMITIIAKLHTLNIIEDTKIWWVEIWSRWVSRFVKVNWDNIKN